MENLFSISHKGFVTQTLTFKLMPALFDSDLISVKIEADNINEYNETKYFDSCPECEMRNFYLLDSFDNETHEIDFMGTWMTCTHDNLNTKIQVVIDSFYAFHKKQDEKAQNTINVLRAFRIEDVVSLQTWEIVKTVTRKGTRR